jgi:5-methylcytosine-specific restriction enzyme subunit McrC
LKTIVNSNLNCREHDEIVDFRFDEETLKEFNDCFQKAELEERVKYLGLHQEFNGSELKLKSHYYVGYRWFSLDNEGYIHITPKSNNGNQADYLKMFLACLKDPIVSKHLDETYKIFFDEKWIKINDDSDEITPLIILQFLQIVKNISKKGLKKGHIKVTENLTSKIKGKILIHQTIKQNHFKNRLDKTVCNHQVFTIDCIENQILKTALMQCSRNLLGINNDDISKLLKFNLNSFELVGTKEVFESDFSKIKHSPFYKDYKEALRLARMIFKRFGFTLNSATKDQKYKIPPFYINMPELFERYVEVKLRQIYKDDLVAGYSQGNGYKTSLGELRPDFTVKNMKLIIDAKYKYWFINNGNDDRFKDDYQQLALYGRVKQIGKDIGLDDKEEATLLFVYPQENGKESVDAEYFESVRDFDYINKFGIVMPIKDI